MLHLCNVFNVVGIWLDRYRTRHTREQDCRTVKEACANRMTTVCNDNNNKEVDVVSGIATDCSGTKAERVTKMCTRQKEALISKTCPWTGWLDEVARWQSENRVSCQVTFGVGVTGIDVSPTGSRNFSGDLTLGTFSRSLLS